MCRLCVFGLALAVFLSGALGCGDSGPKQERKDPFKAREETAPAKKDGKQGGFMKPN
jgi:hypothetical protein